MFKMKTEKKTQKAVAVVILLAAGLIYNHSGYNMIEFNNYAHRSEINSLASEKNTANLISFAADFLKSELNNIFSKK